MTPPNGDSLKVGGLQSNPYEVKLNQYDYYKKQEGNDGTGAFVAGLTPSQQNISIFT